MVKGKEPNSLDHSTCLAFPVSVSPLVKFKLFIFHIHTFYLPTMASVVTLPVTLKSAPFGWSAPAASKPSAPSKHQLYAAGPSYISAARRQILQRSFAEDDKHVISARAAAADAEKSAGDGDPYPGLGEEQEDAATLASDPKEWKKQDHYAVLGLGNLRYLATDDQIKVARKYDCGDLAHSRPSQGPPSPPRQEGKLIWRQRRCLLQVHPKR